MSFLSPQEPRISDVVEDTSPQLGGNLDVNGVDIESIDGGDITLSAGVGVFTAGTQEVDVGGTRVGGDVTGLVADTAGFADAAISGAPAGSVVPGIAAATYDFDVNIDGGGNSPESITTAGGEDYDAIAALMSAAVTGGSVVFVGGSFRVTSATTGVSSSVVVAAGTLGSGGGDLFAAIDAAATVTTTFPAATGGTTTVYTAAVVVDGGASQPISIVGDVAQTYTTLLSELNTDTAGAVWSIAGGNLLLTSDNNTGPSSTIAITDTDVFATLTTFVTINAATAGTGSDGAVVITDTAAPTGTTANKLYSASGALTWNGIDLTTVVSDLSPQLGGALEVNGYSIVSAAGSGFGAGGILRVTAGQGGGNGPGGTVSITAGAGGAIVGDGGVVSVSGGDAAAAGAGGAVNIVGGDGITVDAGGAVNITGGTGGTSSGDGGDVNISGGYRGDDGANDGYGGNVNITTISGTYFPGDINIIAGDSTSYWDSNVESYTGGDVNIKAGSNPYDGSEPYSYGGDLHLTGGDAYTGYAGYVAIYGGQGYYGGSVYIGGASGGPIGSAAGDLILRGGRTGVGGGDNAGYALLKGGRGDGTRASGEVRIEGGDNFTGGSTSSGGRVLIKGGRGAPAGGVPGDVVIEGGVSLFVAGNVVGGNITLTPGDGFGTAKAGDITLTAGAGNPTAGTQEVDVGGAKTGGSVTGLANDATVYTASIVVDGGSPQAIAVTGSTAQTYTTLLSELNTDTTGAVWSLTGGNLLLTSSSTGSSSTIAITDTDLFSTLTNFAAVNAAVAGVSLAGAINIPDQSAPDVTTNKLYSVAGALTWAGTDLTAGGGTPAGADTQVQYNDSGSFGADSGFTFDGTELALVNKRLAVSDATSAQIRMSDTGGDVDEKNWAIDIIGEDFEIRCFDDNWANPTTVFEANRGTGTTVASLTIGENTENVNIEASDNIRIESSLATATIRLRNPVEIDNASGSSTIRMQEIAAALADQGNWGQIWVRDDTPNVLVFTDDAGTDTVLGAGGGGISKFSQDNTTTVAAEVFNHALGTTDVIVQVFDLTVSPKELMIPSTVAITDANNVTVTLAIAPSSSGDYRVVITG